MKRDSEIAILLLFSSETLINEESTNCFSIKIMIDTLALYMTLFGEGSTVSTKRQNDTAAGDDIKERAVMEESYVPAIREPEPIPEMIDDVDPEITLLARKYGPITNGVKIELSLQEALQLFPRQRKRSDAYKSLIKKVKELFNAELTIGTKKKKDV